jgi:hypothetical protein
MVPMAPQKADDAKSLMVVWSSVIIANQMTSKVAALKKMS